MKRYYPLLLLMFLAPVLSAQTNTVGTPANDSIWRQIFNIPPDAEWPPKEENGILFSKGHFIQKQEKPNWCWAACVQSLLKQVKTELTQQEIAEQVDAFPWDRPVFFHGISAILKPYGFTALHIGRPLTDEEMLKALMRDKKIIVCAESNAGGLFKHSILVQKNDSFLHIYVSDPAEGATRKYKPHHFRAKYNWLDTIIVGKGKN